MIVFLISERRTTISHVKVAYDGALDSVKSPKLHQMWMPSNDIWMYSCVQRCYEES